MNTTDEIYDYLIDYEIATEKEISLVCSINGTNENYMVDLQKKQVMFNVNIVDKLLMKQKYKKHMQVIPTSVEILSVGIVIVGIGYGQAIQ